MDELMKAIRLLMASIETLNKTVQEQTRATHSLIEETRTLQATRKG